MFYLDFLGMQKMKLKRTIKQKVSYEVKLTSFICFRRKFCRFWLQYWKSISDPIRNGTSCISCHSHTNMGHYDLDSWRIQGDGDETTCLTIPIFSSFALSTLTLILSTLLFFTLLFYKSQGFSKNFLSFLLWDILHHATR